MAAQQQDWVIKNQVYFRALVIVLTTLLLFMGLFLFYSAFGPEADKPFALFNIIIPALIILQFLLLNPAIISIEKRGDTFIIKSRRVFNPFKKRNYTLPLMDVIGYEVKQSRSIVGGKLVIRFKLKGKEKSCKIDLQNFTMARRSRLLQLMADTFK